MNKELVIKKCEKCGAMVRVLEDCNCDNCGIKCCGEEMKFLVPNTCDGAKEKHMPTYQVYGEKMIVKVHHDMSEDHYIEWIACISEGRERIKYFKPGDEPEGTFKHKTGSLLYAYCNKHGLWKAVVE